MRGRTHWGAFRIGRDHETRKQKNSGNRKGQIPHRMMARTIKMMFAGLCANPDHEREIETTTWRAVTKRTSDTICSPWIQYLTCFQLLQTSQRAMTLAAILSGRGESDSMHVSIDGKSMSTGRDQ